MAFVRKRITKAGSVSTTLVEAYRDDQGRPRQRVLANLHGESDTLCALGKLTLMRAALLEQLEEERPAETTRGAGFVLLTERAVVKHNDHIAQINRELAAIERDGAVISKHCTASDDEIESAAEAHRKRFVDALNKFIGLALARSKADALLRRLSR